MPTPKPNETKKEFMKRCIPIVLKEPDTKDSGHAWQKCNGIWEQSKKKKGVALLELLKKITFRI